MKTLKFHIKKLTKEQFVELKQMCKHTNSLYNCAIYTTTEYYKQTNKYIGYNELYNELKTNIHYKSITAKIAQQTLRLVDKNFRSFFALLNRKANGQYADNVHTPKYKKKGGEFNIILPVDQIKLKDNTLKITKNLKLPFTYKINGTIKQAIIKPNNNYFTMYLQYEENKKEEDYELNTNNHLSIDLGVNNLVSCFSNVGPSFIVNGKPLKSYNHYYNKRKAKIQTKLKKCNNKHWSNKLSILTINRQNYIDNYFNQTVNTVVKYCLKHKIQNVIIGYNKTWKQGLNIGKVNNQKFHSIPYHLFKRKLENKCNEYGITFVLQEESYTSKCSFLDNEDIKKHETYMGKRIKRGLFKTKSDILCNADINGAANIMKKVFSNVKVTNEIEAFIVKPVVLNIFNQQNSIL